MKNFKFLFILLLSISICLSAYSGHIAGGQMYYECMGNNSYKITLKLYTDPFCENCATFDQTVPLGVYNCFDEPMCFGLGQGNSLQTLNVPLGEIRTVGLIAYDGYDIPVQANYMEGTYEIIVHDLASSPVENYYVVYQRCCRGNGVTNLVDPDETGLTIYTKITPNGQSLCYKSGTSNADPVSYGCVNEPFELDFSLETSEADLVVYYLCDPLHGGGIDGGPYAPFLPSSTCSGIIPSPGCPPPYEPVMFQPEFTHFKPLGDQLFILDGLEGTIIVHSNIVGNFLFSVCAIEYVDNKVINVHRVEQNIRILGCLLTSTDEVHVPEDNHFSIYPNPVSSESILQIDMNYPSPIQLQILNVYGQIIGHWEHPFLERGKHTFSLNDISPGQLSPGQYILKGVFIHQGSSSTDVKRIIIQ